MRGTPESSGPRSCPCDGALAWRYDRDALGLCPHRCGQVTHACRVRPLQLERNVALFKNLLAVRQSNAAADLWLHLLFPWLFAPSFFEIRGAAEQAAMLSLAYPFAQSTKGMAHQIAALDGYDPKDIADVPCPVQALLAGDDLLMPAHLARTTLSNVAVHMIAGAGHSIHWDAPDAVATHLQGFITLHEETLT
ncbi:alpha/beta fold hydrolase [Sulfitobacter sp.]|nr:alpha/beta fold hydrolase [Sulfitobacter sp.]